MSSPESPAQNDSATGAPSDGARADASDVRSSAAPPADFAPAADAAASSPDAPPAPLVIPKRGIKGWLYDYFLGEEPTVGVAMVPLCMLSMLLFTRHPRTNFIFDEQEALLANPYVRAVADPASKIRWIDAFYRDFWGLTPERTIGSYRPVPDIVWRALWALGARDQTPFLHHWINVLLHGLNGALMTILVLRLTKRRGLAWLAGAFFVGTAVVTEAVSGVVGLADVLGGTGALLALLSLTLPMWGMPFALFFATLLGLYSKESALCIVPLVPFAALMLSQLTHPGRPMRLARMGLALVATFAAFILYVEARRRMFPVHTPTELTEEANAGKPLLARTFAALLRWYAQPGLPRDPLNNPFIDAPPDLRVAGALRVYWRGLVQIVFPWTLSGDYSSPQEPVPATRWFPESILGVTMLVGPIVLGPALGVIAWLRARRAKLDAAMDLSPIVGVGMMWVVVSYIPVSNIPVVLPTCRAERFWYFPAIGTALILAVLAARLYERAQRAASGPSKGVAFVKWTHVVAAGVFVYLGFQTVCGRRHANDYTDDLVFWRATREAVPRSAKAHLNYSVMLGARQDLTGRLAANEIAYELAPKWPMASVYLGDTLCRLHRAPEAMPHYIRGFELGPNDMNLIALGVQCLWDEGMLTNADSDAVSELQEAADKHPGSWLKYIVDDTVANGAEHKGVNPKYRPRGYNEGPKKDE